MVHPGSSPGSHVESCHRRGRRSVWKQRRINRISRKFRYVHQCNFIRMLQRTHRIRWMYFEVTSQSVSLMNWFTKSWMSSRSFPPVRAVIQHAMETSSYPQEFAAPVVLGLIMVMGLNELCIIWLKNFKGLLHSIYFHPSLVPLSVARYSPGLRVTRSRVSF